MQDISIIIPAYNEEGSLEKLFRTLDEVISSELIGFNVEVIVVDDHSSDLTNALLIENQPFYVWLKYIRLLKNSGSHIAILCGLSHCNGDKAIIIGADLQDPPEVIPELLNKSIETGSNIVLGNRLNRSDPIMKKIPSYIFNHIVSKYIFSGFPAGGGDVFLLSRNVINAVIQSLEKNVNIFILMLSFSDDVVVVDYNREQRFAGTSKWTIRKLIKLAYDTVITAGNTPITLIRWIGGLSVIVSIASIIYILIAKYYGLIYEIGWPSLLAMISFFGGMIMFSLSILGEYIWRNFDQTRARPIYLIEDKKL